MAEVELNRLVVRIMGDGSDMRREFQNASKVAEDFSSSVSEGSGKVVDGNREIESSSGSAADAMANSAQTMGAFDGINRQAGRSLSMTGRMISQLGVAAGTVNPQIGQSVALMGMLSSGAGNVISSIDRMKKSTLTLSTLFANPAGLAVITAMGAGLALWKISSDRAAAAVEKQKKYMEGLSVSVKEYLRLTEEAGKITHVGLGGKREYSTPTQEEAVTASEKKEDLLQKAREESAAQSNAVRIMVEDSQQKDREWILKNANDVRKFYGDEQAKSWESLTDREKEGKLAVSNSGNVRNRTKFVGPRPEDKAAINGWNENLDKQAATTGKLADAESDAAKAREVAIAAIKIENQAIQEATASGRRYQSSKKDEVSVMLESQKAMISYNAQMADMDITAARVGEKPAMKSRMDFWAKNKDKADTPEKEAAYDAGMKKAEKEDSDRMMEAHRKEMEAIQDKTDVIGMSQIAAAKMMALRKADRDGYGPLIAGSKAEAIAKQMAEQATYDDNKATEDKLALLKLEGVEAVKAQADLRATAIGLEGEAKAKMVAGAASVYAAEKQREFRLATEQANVESKNLTREIVAASSPRDELLQSAVAVANAYDLWERANRELSQSEKDAKKEQLEKAEAQKVLLKQTQEGAALHEKHLSAQEKFNLEQEKMQKLLGKGGFTIQDYNKELMALWLQLNQEYSLDLKMGGSDVMAGNSNKARIAMWNQQKSIDMAKSGFGINRMEPKAGGANPLDGNKQGAAQQAQVDTAQLMRQMVDIARTHWVGTPVTLVEAN